MKQIYCTLVLMLSAVCLFAQEGPEMGVEVGFQSLDVNGNEDVYRSQINGDDGILFRSFYYNLVDADDKYSGYDRIRIDAGGFAASPQGHFRLQMGMGGIYDLKLKYLRMEHYNALPSIANPFLTEGITPGQHTLDRVRETFDFDLKLLPGKAWQPIIRFHSASYDGPGTSTYHIGQDEFAIVSERDDQETEFAVGVVFDLGKFSGEFMQGWRNLDTEEDVSLATGAESGNNIREVLGREIELDQLERSYESNADMPTTTFHVKGELHERIHVLGSYIRTDLETDWDESELAMGSLASFQIQRYYNGLNQTISSDTDGEQWRSHVQANVILPADFQWRVIWSHFNRELDGHALISTLYTDAVTFGNGDPEDFLNQLDARTYMERTEDRLETDITSRDLHGFRFWAGFRTDSIEAQVDPDLAEIVVPGGQGGQFERDIDTVRAGVMYKIRKHEIKFEWESRDADSLIVRTDYQEWDKRTLRFKTKPIKWLQLSGRAQWIDQENDHPDIAYTADSTNYGVDALIKVKKAFEARLSYGVYDFESDVRIIEPQDFSWTQSIHREDGDELGIDLSYNIKAVTIRAAYSNYETEGVLDFSLERLRGEFRYAFNNQLSISAEYGTVDYEEDVLSSYDSDSFAVLLHWSR